MYMYMVGYHLLSTEIIHVLVYGQDFVFFFFLTLGAHAQGLLYLVCVCVSFCYPYSSKPSTKALYQRFQKL